MTAVLDGIRVLDFGRYLAGPFCGALLGDLGAEVIRIERIEGGEDRTLAPVTDDDIGAVFLQANRNKRGMTLNPSTEQGRKITRQLVAASDVVVANLPPKVLRGLALDYESLCQVKPDIILTTINAFGGGAWEDKLGFDGLAQAMAGNLHLSGAHGVPTRAFTPYVDYATASLCALSTVAAIMHRNRTGEGQLVEGALLKTALTFMNAGIIEQQLLGLDREATLNRHPWSGPSDVFATKDGWIVCTVIGRYQFGRWCELVGAQDLLEDERFVDDRARGDNGQVLSEKMAEWCAGLTTVQALEALEAAKVPGGPVYRPQQVLDDSHIQQLGLFEEVDYPGASKPVLLSGYPVSLSATPGEIRTRAPMLGEHTDEILAELGYSASAIESLRAQQVV